MKKQFLVRYVSAIILSIVLSGCSQTPVNLSDAKAAIVKYYESGKFDWELNQTVDLAKKYFMRIKPTEHSVVLFDIDDTILSNYCDMKSIDFGYIPKLSHQWILRATAPVIAPTKELYDQLIAQGFHIIFLTGRQEDEYDATVKNLSLWGISTFDRLIVRAAQEKNLAAQDYKTKHRKALQEEGFVIVGSVGDQWSDLAGGSSGHIVKIPNYTYIIK